MPVRASALWHCTGDTDTNIYVSKSSVVPQYPDANTSSNVQRNLQVRTCPRCQRPSSGTRSKTIESLAQSSEECCTVGASIATYIRSHIPHTCCYIIYDIMYMLYYIPQGYINVILGIQLGLHVKVLELPRKNSSEPRLGDQPWEDEPTTPAAREVALSPGES